MEVSMAHRLADDLSLGFFYTATEVYMIIALLAVALMVFFITLHSSLSQDTLHGHQIRNSYTNALLVFSSLSLLVPYLRFKDLHLAQHRHELLIDPYDGPESNFMDPDLWQRLPKPVKNLLSLNNTIMGRMVIGPLLGR